MPESDFTPEDSFDETNRDRVTDELLNASELQTVLDMLAVMETAEELSQLQALTEAQKRQVWEATPETLKQKLWQLRNSPAPDAAVSIAAENLQSSEPELEIDESEVESQTDAEAELEDEIEDLGQELDLTEASYALMQPELGGVQSSELSNELSQTPAVQPSEPFYADRPMLRVGDRVVLKPHPKLSAAELKAVWQMERIQGSDGAVSEPTLGTRSYPLAWMIVYARTQLEQSMEDSSDDFDSEDEF